jgi:hypothetical protein
MTDTRLRRSCSSLSDGTYCSRVTHTPRSPRRGPLPKRPFLPLLAGILVIAVVATIAQVHQTAAAATISEREEVNKIVFELSDDNIVGITFQDWDFRYEDNLDAAPRDFTKEKIDTALAAEQKIIKETLGWDVASDDDFDKFRTEVNQLRRALNEALNSPNLPKTYSGPWAESLHVIDQLLAVECRGRCVPSGELVDNVISAAAVGSAVAAMIAEVADVTDHNLHPELVDAVLIVLTAVEIFGAFVIFHLTPDLIGIKSSTLRVALTATAGAALIAVHQRAEDAKAIAAAQSPPTTPKDGMGNGAKAIADQTPTQGDNPKDFDIIHDEL